MKGIDWGKSTVACQKPEAESGWEDTVCPLCGAERRGQLYALHAERLDGEVSTTLWQCGGCGFSYLSPRPTLSSIGDYYSPGEYYAHVPVTRRPKDRLRQWVLAVTAGLEPLPPGILGKLGSAFAHVVARFEVDVVIPAVSKGQLLDVGCGNGSRFGWLAGYGWGVSGVETDAQACSIAAQAGMRVYQGSLLDARLPEGRFDVVVLNHSLEHMHDPAGVLRECLRVLKPDGLCVVDVPNFDCCERRLFGSEWLALEVSRHLGFFNAATLASVMERTGFGIATTRFKAPGPRTPFRSLRNVKPGRSRVVLLPQTLVLAIAGPVAARVSRSLRRRLGCNVVCYATKP